MGIILIGILIFVCLNVPISEGDTFFHLAVGKQICENGFITKDPFSIHALNYSPQQWLSDVIFYNIYKLGGYPALFIFQYLYVIVFVFVLYKINRTINSNPKQNILFAILGVVMFVGFSLTIRPQIFTYLIFIIEIYLLEKFYKASKLRNIVGLAILTIACANLHIGYLPMMILVIIPYIVASMLPGYGKIKSTKNIRTSFKFITFISLILFAACLNPYGPKKLLYFTTITDSYLTSFIQEWQSPGLSYGGLLMFFIIFVTIALLIVTKKQIELRWCLLLGGLCFMTLISIRYFIYFELAVCMFCNLHFELNFENNEKLNRMFFRRSGVSIIYVIAIIAVVTLKTMNAGWIITNLNSYPVQAVNYMKEHNPKLKLFNEYNEGAYLLFNDIPVFIDSRADLYSETQNNTHVLKDYFNLNLGKSTYQQVLNKYKIERVLTTQNSIVAMYIALDSDYVKKFEDTNYVIFERELIKR